MSDIKEILKVGLCDDEAAALLVVEEKLRAAAKIQFPQMDVMVWAFQDGESLLKQSKETPFNIVFLDIEMPEWNGFRLAERLHLLNPNTHLAFVSGYENHVFEAYEYTPLWFVRKSMLEKDMLRALQKYLRLTANWWTRYKVEGVFGNREVLLKDIMYFECNCHDVIVKTIEVTYHTYGSLTQVEEKLTSGNFIRIHRNYLVNADFIANVGIKEVVLIDGTRLSFSKERKKAVREGMKKHASRKL